MNQRLLSVYRHTTGLALKDSLSGLDCDSGRVHGGHKADKGSVPDTTGPQFSPCTQLWGLELTTAAAVCSFSSSVHTPDLQQLPKITDEHLEGVVPFDPHPGQPPPCPLMAQELQVQKWEMVQRQSCLKSSNMSPSSSSR